jgi:glutathionyl-hydroquinone reductase
VGVMIDGVWRSEDPAVSGDAAGSFERPASSLRSWVTRDGSAGPSGRAGYRAEPGRYHLYIAEGCPWAHRTWIVRKLKGLEEAITLSKVAGMGPEGWVFDPSDPRYRDHLHGRKALHELYSLGAERYSGRVTVPVLWDKQSDTIVNNESSEIVRMLGSAFDDVTGNSLDLYPEALRGEIDAASDRIYHGLNNGVYRAGFAATQQAYDEAFDEVFATLDWLEERLATRRYLIGPAITEADWRLFPTLVRFDVAYLSAFRCNLRRVVDYPNLWAYTRDLYQQPGVAETVVLAAYKRGYHSIPLVRHPRGIIPRGPAPPDFAAPHGRERLSARAGGAAIATPNGSSA